MDSNTPECSLPVDLIQKAVISRRGGVRVRGGRLPPIRIRDCSLTPTSTKKAFEPKIPQRRVKVKEEEPTHTNKPQESDNRRNYESKDSRQKSTRGRGRGPKVFVQSEGTFLGEGPALKTKKEAPTSGYERERGPRGSKSKEADLKFDAKSLKYLFENQSEDEMYDENLILPVRFPLLKQEVKQEFKDEVKIEIKQEILDEDAKEELKIFIKKEPIDPTEEQEVVSEQLEKFDISEKSNTCDLGDALKFIKGEGTLMLIQMPTFLPFKKISGSSDQPSSSNKSSKDAKTSTETEVVVPQIDLKSLGEGRIGKLQVFKSGKMRMVTGSMTMSVETTSEVQTQFEAASVLIGNSQEDGDIAMLGRIDHKLILRPYFEEDIKRMVI